MIRVDVAIVGGGPGGSTCAGLLKKYAPELKVAVFEREVFPREHVGESQLPPISKILKELMAPQLLLHHLLQALEVMLNEGWVKGTRDPQRPGINLETTHEGLIVHTNTEPNRA